MRYRRSLGVCAEPGCWRLTETPDDTRCPEHKTTRQARMRDYNRQRRRDHPQFHESAEWRRISKAFLLAHPRCISCGAPATHTDHKQPRPRGAPLDRERWDREANLQPMCQPCHASKSLAEKNAERRRQRA